MAEIIANIKNIVDNLGNIVYPQTKTKAVFNDEGQLLDNILKELQKKPQIIAETLLASNWDTESKTYNFETNYPNATYNLNININGEIATDEEFTAWNAIIPVSSYTTNILISKGEIPNIDIPIILTIEVK